MEGGRTPVRGASGRRAAAAALRWGCAPVRRLAAVTVGRIPFTVRLRLALLTACTAIVAGVVALGVTLVLVTQPANAAYSLFSVSAALNPVEAQRQSANVAGAPATGARPGSCLPLVQALVPRTAGQPPVVPAPAGGQPSGRAVAACVAALAALAADGSGPALVADRSGSARILRFTAQVSAAQRSQDLSRLLVGGGIALGILSLMALAAGWWVAGRILRPLQVMTRRVQGLSAQTPLGRIRLPEPQDELKELADTFDGLLGRLDSALAADRRFVANASHELRTPLAIQETLLDVALADPHADVAALREMAGRVRQVGARSKRLIDGLLALARSQQGLGRWEPVDLATVVRDAIEASEADASRRGVRIDPDLQPGPVLGDPVLLERLAGNLVENAVRYNVRGGWVRVLTAAEGERALLTVANSGPAVDPAEVAALFEPFRRGGRDRTDSHRGAGLGLSIVQAVAAAHGGTVEPRGRPEGGLEVTVALPAARK